MALLSDTEREYLLRGRKLNGEKVNDSYAAVLQSRIRQKIRDAASDFRVIVENRARVPHSRQLIMDLIIQPFKGIPPTAFDNEVGPIFQLDAEDARAALGLLSEKELRKREAYERISGHGEIIDFGEDEDGAENDDDSDEQAEEDEDAEFEAQAASWEEGWEDYV